MAELQTINESGELTEIRLGGTGEEKKVMLHEDLGNFAFDGDSLKHDGNQMLLSNAGVTYLIADDGTSGVIMTTDRVDIQNSDGVNTQTIQIYKDIGIFFPEMTITMIDNVASDKIAVTKEWVESKVTGATGSFQTTDDKTITVTNGLITAIVDNP